MWNEDDRRWLYEQMQNNGVDTGSYEEFTNSLNDETDRDWYYNKSISLGLDVGSADDFYSMMVEPSTVTNTQPTAQPTVQPTQTTSKPSIFNNPLQRARQKMLNQMQGVGDIVDEPLKQTPVAGDVAQPKKAGVASSIPVKKPMFVPEVQRPSERRVREAQEQTALRRNGLNPNFKAGLTSKSRAEMEAEAGLRTPSASSKAFDVAPTLTERSEQIFQRGLDAANNQPSLERAYEHLRAIDDELEKLEEREDEILKHQIASSLSNIPGSRNKKEESELESIRERIEKLKKDREKAQENADTFAEMERSKVFSDEEQERLNKERFARATEPSALYIPNHDAETQRKETARRQTERRIEALDEGARHDSGFWRGLLNVVKNPSTYTMGMTDLADIGAETAAYEAYQQGEATDAQKELLEQVVFANNAEAENQDRIGNMYRFGQITGQALPFVAEFYLTGGFGSLTSGIGKAGTKLAIKSTTSELGRRIIKATGRNILGRAVKMGGDVAKDVAGATLMANTTGGMKTATDIVRRNRGSLGKDANGDYAYEGGKDLGRAIYEGEVANILEYYTEMLGAHMDKAAGKLGNRLINKLRNGDNMTLQNVANVLSRINRGEYKRSVQSVLDRSNIQGYPSEVLEEEANILLNSILVGDNKFSDLGDRKQQTQILGGMLFSIGFMQATPLVGGTALDAAEYYLAKRGYEKADKVASFRLTADKWNPLRERIDVTPNDKMQKILDEVLDDDTMYIPEKEAVLNYICELLKFRGFNEGMAAKAREQAETTDEKERQAQDASNAVNHAFVEGHEMADPKQMAEAKSRYEFYRLLIGEYVSEDMMQQLDTNPLAALDVVRNDDTLSEAEKQAVADYVNAKATYDGMQQRVQDDIEVQTEQANAEIDANTNANTDMLERAVMKDGERQVYIVSGRVVMTEDGEMVNADASDNTIVVRDVQTGKTEMVSPSDILRVDAQADPEALKAETTDTIREQAEVAAETAQNGTLTFAQGETFDILDDNGAQFTVEVIGDNGDGTIAINVNGDEYPRVPSEKLQQWHDAFRAKKVADEATAQASEQPSGMVEGAPEDFPEGMKMVLRDEDGTEKKATSYGRVHYENGTPVPDAEGRIIEYKMDGELHHEYPDNLKKHVVRYKPQEDESEANAVTPSEEAVAAPVEEPTAEMPTEAPVEEQVVEPAEAAVDADAMPMTIVQKGSGRNATEEQVPDWEAAGAERSYRYLYDELGLERDDANAIVKENENEAKKALEKLEQSRPKPTANPLTFKQQLDAWQAQVDEAAANVQLWNDISKMASAELLAQQREAADQARLGTRINALDEPTTLEDEIMRAVYGGLKLIWDNDTMTRTRGLGSHLSSADAKEEKRQRRWMLASREKGGMYPEEAAQWLKENADPGTPLALADEQDVFNTLLDVALRYPEKKMLGEAIVSMAEDAARREAEEEAYYREREEREREREAFAKQNGFDSYAELEAYESAMAETLPQFTEQEENEIQQIITEEYERENERKSSAGAVQRGTAVLPTEEVGVEGRSGEGEVEQGRTSETDGEVSGAVPEESAAAAVEGIAEKSDAVEPDGAELGADEAKSKANGLFEYFKGTIGELIDAAKDKGNVLVKKIIAPVSSRLKTELSAKGVDVEGYNHVLDNSAIRHTLKQHGTNQELKRGQVPITNEDFDRLPDIVENYDNIEVEEGKRGEENIIYSKSYPDGTTIYVEEKRDKRKELAAVTMWKKKSTTLTDANRNATPISDLSGTDSDSKVTEKEGNAQEKEEKSSENSSAAQKMADVKPLGAKASKAEKIEDVGEKIGGARKDIVTATADKINVNGETFAKIFPKFNFHKLIADGLDTKLAAGLSYVYDMAKDDYKRRKKRFTEEKALSMARFYANYAKGYLMGNTSSDFTNGGWVFTDYGKKVIDFGTALRERLFDEMGEDMFDIDLTPFQIEILETPEESKRGGSTTYFRNGEPIKARYAVRGGQTKFFTEEEREDAIKYFVDTVKKAVSYKAANPFNLGVFYSRDPKKPGYVIEAKIGGQWVELTPWGSEYGNKYLEEHRAELQAMAQRKAEEMKGEKKQKARPEAKVYVSRPLGEANTKSQFYSTIGDERVVLSPIMNVWEVGTYMKEHMDEMKQKAQELLNQYLDEKEANKGWKPELNIGGIRSRVGKDWRGGKDVSAEQMRDEFGFRGIEFGNYVTQKERQKLLNECYDGLHDMAEILGVSPKALSLNGQLGFAIGARGGGNAKAHYEPERNVINLTKKNGWGALAHEWWHALDYYFGQREKARPATRGIYKDDTRAEMKAAFDKLMETINGSDYAKRSERLDKVLNKKYFATDTELGARAFGDYILKRLIEQGQVNDFLTHFTAKEDWNGKSETYPYPIEEEAQKINDAFQNLFDTIEERADEETGNVELFEPDVEYGKSASRVNNQLFDTAKKKFGTTYDIREAGYVLPDGVMLDFSGRHELFGADDSAIRGRRTTDHRAINQLAYAYDENGDEYDTGIETNMSDFIKAGAIRIDDNAGVINLSAKPTAKQKEVLRRLIARNDGDVTIDFGDGWDTEHSVEYEGASARRVISDIDKYYDEGIRPESDVAMEDETPYNGRVDDMFYSNALHAVKGINQEKATPEQWLKMIEKQGGLKAGEDKWLGLSDWLKGQDKKSLTKQEVLDYIRENQIEVEDVEYGDTAGVEMFLDYRDEYKRYFHEAEAEGADDPGDVAMERMKEEHGEDFELGFYAYGDELQWDTDNDYVQWEMENQGIPRPIDEIRMGYTTKGLDNKREIALVVPSIEPWGESDTIHFGDAGEGRAVAWVRFGDTEIPAKDPSAQKAFDDAQKAWDEFGGRMYDKYGAVYPMYLNDEEAAENKRLLEQYEQAKTALKKVDAPVRVLVIDEIQSKRHQEGRERGYRTQETVDEEERLGEAVNQAQEAYDAFTRMMGEKYDGAYEDIYPDMSDGERTEADRLEQEVYAASERLQNHDVSGIPDAPFEKNWHELAMKRMLRYAAENGYDKVAWTKGEQQAKRYSLANHVQDLYYKKNEDGTYKISGLAAIRRDGRTDYQDYDFDHQSEKDLQGLLGKELADKIIEGRGTHNYTHNKEGGWSHISPRNLKLGGEGMKGFYDDILPRFMNKYGKKWGVKVGEVNLPNVEPDARTMWAVDVTPEMKESVMQGQPLFEPTVEYGVGSLERVNEQFNERLMFLDKNRNAKDRLLHLGRPSEFLRKAGVVDGEILLEFDSLIRKAKETYKHKHPFDVEEIKDLPKAISYPIAVFEKTSNQASPDDKVILTELRKGDKSYIAVLRAKTKKRKGGVVHVVNEIQTVFPKDVKGIIRWIQQEIFTQVDKEKALRWIEALQTRPGTKINNEELVNAAKVIQSADNSKLFDKFSSENIDGAYESSDGQLTLWKSLMPEEEPQTEQNRGEDYVSMAERIAKQSEHNDAMRSLEDVSDAELLSRIADVEDGKDVGTSSYVYDRRHNPEYSDAVARYSDQLEESNTTLEEAYDMLAKALKDWRDGGFASPERTELRAQMDVLDDWIAEREEEGVDLEDEADEQTLEEVRDIKAEHAFDPTTLRLRKLEEGETCNVERRYTESGTFDFTGSERIESADDVAYIFRQLENETVENSFLVLVKDGRPTILHLGMGDYASTAADGRKGLVAAAELNPDGVWFVHNHPSGNITPSREDAMVLERMGDLFGYDKLQPGIIIDTTSGQYAEFYTKDNTWKSERPKSVENEVPHKVYQFSQQVFAPDWNPMDAFTINGSDKVAEFVSSHRLGEHPKMSLLVLDNANHVTGNVFLPATRVSEIDAKEVARYVQQMGGVKAVIYGSYEYDRSQAEKTAMEILGKSLKKLNVNLLDVLHTVNAPQGHKYHSAYEWGLSLGEEDVNYEEDLVRDDSEGEEGRDEEIAPRDRVIAQDAYERMVSSAMYQFREAVQDSMLGLKKLYEAILPKTRIEDVPSGENAYLAENALSSMNSAQQHDYYRTYMKPLLDEIYKLVGKSKGARQELTDYMMAKHGLERNRKFAERDAQAKTDELVEALEQRINDKRTSEKNKAMYQSEIDKAKTDGYDKLVKKYRQRDYSGLTALTGETDVEAAEAKAQQMVDEFESKHDVTNLWSLTNQSTKAILDKLFDSGLLSKESLDQIKGMFDYYIPLQGWDEKTSDEVYGYLTSKGGPLGGSPIKHAKGRSSKADDPIATIGLMADTAIRQANRNEMKLRFLNFVLNHPSDLVSVNKLWLRYNEAQDEWEPVFADIKPDDTPKDVERKVAEFEQRMEQLAKFDSRYKRGSDAKNIPYKVVGSNLREHQVLVKRNGETFVVTINGNPRAAQALNGLTNPDVEQSGWQGNLTKLGDYVNHYLSAIYTTRDPNFVISNFLRDTLYANSMTWVRESPAYALQYHNNFGKVNPATMRNLIGKWEKGELDDSNPTERMFHEFMENGGETGYTIIRDLEAHKDAIADELKKQANPLKRWWGVVSLQLDLLNRAVENTARFAAYVTSREAGRSIQRSIYDAKEVSVNFNKKGSGGKMVNAVGQTKLGKAASELSGVARALFVFWNAGVQGTTNFARAAQRHKGKMAFLIGTQFLMGFTQALLSKLLGDDEDEYYNLPEYTRRSNLCVYVGNGYFLTIPLPVEFRTFHGLGELAASVIFNKERYSGGELAMQIVRQLSQALPLDFLEGNGGFHAFIPSVVKPAIEAGTNKAWTGLPIYKDTDWNKNDPEWTKVYSNADRNLVAASRWLNEQTVSKEDAMLSGNAENAKGWADVVNPSQVEYVLNGYLGGYFKLLSQLTKTGETAVGARDFDPRNIPILNRVLRAGDEEMALKRLKNEFYRYRDEYLNTQDLLRKYKKSEHNDVISEAERIDFLNHSPKYARYLIFDDYNNELKNINEMMKYASPKEQGELQNDYNNLLGEMIRELHSYDDTKDPSIVEKHTKNDAETIYINMRTNDDLRKDAALESAQKEAKARGNESRKKRISEERRKIREKMKLLGRDPEKDDQIMEQIRRRRDAAIERLDIEP